MSNKTINITHNAKRDLSSRSFYIEGWLGEGERGHDHPGKDVDFHKRVLNEYKEVKAYRLFDSGWLKEIS